MSAVSILKSGVLCLHDDCLLGTGNNPLEHRAFLAHVKFNYSTSGTNYGISWPKSNRYPTVLYNQCSYSVIEDAIANRGVGYLSQHCGVARDNLSMCEDIFGNGGDVKLFPGLPKTEFAVCDGEVICTVTTQFKHPGKKFAPTVIATTSPGLEKNKEAVKDMNNRKYAVLEVVPYQASLNDVHMRHVVAIPTELKAKEVSVLEGSALKRYSKAFNSVYVMLLITPKENTPFTVRVSLQIHKQDNLGLPVSHVPSDFIKMESKDCDSFNNFTAARDELLCNLKYVINYMLDGAQFGIATNRMRIMPVEMAVDQAAGLPNNAE